MSMRDEGILRWERESNPDFTRRFTERLKVSSSGCLVWTGHLTPSGYGQVRLPVSLGIRDGQGAGLHVMTHRVAWVTRLGVIPDGLLVDHGDPIKGCRNRACSNVEHLTLTTPLGNTVTAIGSPPSLNRAKTECIRGHDLSEPGALYSTELARGKRICIKCSHIRGRARYLASRRIDDEEARR